MERIRHILIFYAPFELCTNQESDLDNKHSLSHLMGQKNISQKAHGYKLSH